MYRTLAAIIGMALAAEARAQAIPPGDGLFCFGTTQPAPAGATVSGSSWIIGLQAGQGCPGASPPPPPPPGPPVATITQPSPFVHATYTLTGTATVGATVKVNWFNGSGIVAPAFPWSNTCTVGTDGSLSCPGVVIDNPGRMGWLWMQVNSLAPVVAWQGNPQ
jgi:hypothetical protein